MAERSNLQRISNAVILIVIACAVLGVGLRRLHGENAGPVTGVLSMFFLPGMILAFAKFLVTAARAGRDRSARIPALLLLGVLIFPFALMKAPKEPAAAEAVSAAAEPDSEQFRAGAEWAEENGPERRSECEGSDEFRRGCRSVIEARYEREEAEGERWAEETRPRKVSQCAGRPTHVELGCHRYFNAYLAQAKPEGQGKYEGMTTAECQAEVNAIHELAHKLYLEDGNPHGAEVNRRKHWLPELEDCENYDKTARFKTEASSAPEPQPQGD